MKLPQGLVPSREGDVFLVIVPHTWGKDANLDKAIDIALREGGYTRREVAQRPWQVWSVHPDSYVTGMGAISHPEDHQPVKLAQHKPEAARAPRRP